jgi:predicted transcriptional regulator
MAVSGTSKEMLNYFNQLDQAEQKSVLQMLKDFVSKRKEISLAQSIEEYNKELEQADAEIEAGNFVLHEDVVKYFSKK